jgi:hypothetical protein
LEIQLIRRIQGGHLGIDPGNLGRIIFRIFVDRVNILVNRLGKFLVRNG